MKAQKKKNSINLEKLAGGAFAEKLNEALMQVAENIQNPNTEATTKRGITINIKFTPNKNRQMVSTQISVTTKLAATEAIDTQMIMGVNLKTGKVEVAEYDSTNGQLSIFPDEPDEEEADEYELEPEPAEAPSSGKVLDLRNRGKKVVELIPGRDFDTETGEVYEKAEQV